MSNTSNRDDEDWNYLANVLDVSNNDEDLIDRPDDKLQEHAEPQTQLEAQIKNLVSPNAELSSISGLRPGKVHLHGQFSQATGRYVRRGMHVTEAVFTDNTGSVRVVWFNQPYKAASLRKSVDYELRGSFALNRGRFQVNNANIRLLSEGCAPFERGAKK